MAFTLFEVEFDVQSSQTCVGGRILLVQTRRADGGLGSFRFGRTVLARTEFR
jgi:hypothetical protein